MGLNTFRLRLPLACLLGFSLSAFALSPSADAACGNGATITPAENLVTCVASLNGTNATLNMAAGTYSWVGDMPISGMTLLGTTSAIVFPVNPVDATLPTNLPDRVITNGTIVFNKHATFVTRVSGVKMTGTTYQKFRMTGPDTSELAIFDNSYVQYGDQGTLAQQSFFINTCGSLMHHMVFDALGTALGSQADLASAKCGNWSDPFTMGNADATGKKNNYIEDSWAAGWNNNLVDADEGSRMVIRYNTLIDTAFVCHGGGNNDNDNDTSIEGCRFFEIYNNRFVRIYNPGNAGNATRNMNWWVWMRGAHLLFANNNLDNLDNPAYGTGVQLKLGVGCTGFPYPEKYQVGQSTTTPTTPPTRPVLIFGNTGPGSTASNFVAVVQNGTNNAHLCANPSAYIALNRDYYLSNQWNWVPFTHPHPAQSKGGASGGDTTPPLAPVNLRVN